MLVLNSQARWTVPGVACRVTESVVDPVEIDRGRNRQRERREREREKELSKPRNQPCMTFLKVTVAQVKRSCRGSCSNAKCYYYRYRRTRSH